MQLPLSILSILSISSVAVARVQPTANDSPQETYEAIFDGALQGSVEFQGLSNGSIEISVDLSGFPEEGGPFTYHVHEAPVPSNGSCAGTLLHLNPYGGQANATSTDELEISDLSGRYGALQGDTETLYVDEYLSLNSDSEAFIGGLSVTVHLANSSRLACANITHVHGESSSASNSTASNGTTGGDEADSGAANFAVSGAALGMAAGAVALLI